jgi:hypothetical protein
MFEEFLSEESAWDDEVSTQGDFDSDEDEDDEKEENEDDDEDEDY